MMTDRKWYMILQALIYNDKWWGCVSGIPILAEVLILKRTFFFIFQVGDFDWKSADQCLFITNHSHHQTSKRWKLFFRFSAFLSVLLSDRSIEEMRRHHLDRNIFLKKFINYMICKNCLSIQKVKWSNSSISFNSIKHVNKVEWLQVLLCITNNSIKYQSLFIHT